MGTTVLQIRIELIFRQCGNRSHRRGRVGLCAQCRAVRSPGFRGSNCRAYAGRFFRVFRKSVVSEHVFSERPNTVVVEFLSPPFRRVFGTETVRKSQP
jgi:hypothetical protein